MGADVVEAVTPFDPTGGTSLLAATVTHELLCLLGRGDHLGHGGTRGGIRLHNNQLRLSRLMGTWSRQQNCKVC